MKIIDLLNKIANGEENIRVKHKLFELDYINMENMNVYYPEKINSFSLMTFIKILNDEVEIIEEDKKIERIKWRSSVEHLKQVDRNTNEVIDKINEIIDEVNKLKDDRK